MSDCSIFFEGQETFMQNVNKKENWVLFLILLQVIGSQMSKPDSVC